MATSGMQAFSREIVVSEQKQTRPDRSLSRSGRKGAVSILACVLGIGVIGTLQTGMASEKAVVLPPPSVDSRPSGLQKAVLAGGCFWGVQGVFQHVRGVTSAVSGYAGGTKETAQYDTVGSGTTGHAEAVEVTFDPKVISYGEILQIYFSVAHDPTELNRRAQTPALSTGQRSSQPTPTRSVSPRRTSRSLTKRTPSTSALSPASSLHARFTQQRITIRTFWSGTPPIRTSSSTMYPRWSNSERCFQPLIAPRLYSWHRAEAEGPNRVQRTSSFRRASLHHFD